MSVFGMYSLESTTLVVVEYERVCIQAISTMIEYPCSYAYELVYYILARIMHTSSYYISSCFLCTHHDTTSQFLED